jgi:ComF family protein
MRCQPQYKGQVYIWSKNKQSCLLCDEPADGIPPVCTACETELPWLGDHCRTFEYVIAPWTYSFPVDSLITRFKHNAKWPFGRLLAELLAQYLQHRFEDDLQRPHALIPVPLANRRLRQRGFNQAAMLAHWLSDALDIPCDERLLLRTQDTDAQQALNAQARRKNLRNAFTLIPGAAVKGLHLALIDDVLTTGATAQALAWLLMDAGAARVDVYCLARTPKPGETP